MRLRWEQAPAPVRAVVAEALGGPVVAVRPAAGGFSPGLAAVVRSAAGRELFVKAVSAEPNAFALSLLRDERARYGLLPAAAGRPALVAARDEHGWVTLCFEVVAGVLPEHPWRPDRLAAVLDLLVRHAALDPGPAAVDVRDQFAPELGGWARLAAELPGPARSAAGPAAAGPPDPWRPHLPALVELEAGWPAAAAGTGLVHGDLRADNVLLGDAGPTLVDWAYACRGNPLLDVVHLLLESIAGGAPGVPRGAGPLPGPADADRRLARVLPALGRTPDQATALVVAFTGWYTWLSRLPPLPGLPALRPFQGLLAGAGRRWISSRTGLQ